jgi:DNA topoisomerase 2-associated protein PAT1
MLPLTNSFSSQQKNFSSPVPHPFIAFLSFGKGKKAVPRIFRLIDNDQRVTIMTMIVVHIGVLDVVRRGQLRPGERQLPSAVRDEVELFSQAVLPSLFSYVSEAELNIIIGLLGILLDSADVQRVARSKVGLGILAMLLSRAELIKQSDDAPEDDWSQWFVSPFLREKKKQPYFTFIG